MPPRVKEETDSAFDEEDEEQKIKSLFEDVPRGPREDERFRAFVSRKQFVRRLEENSIYLSTNRLTRLMKTWGYSGDDRSRGERGWFDIKLTMNMTCKNLYTLTWFGLPARRPNHVNVEGRGGSTDLTL